MITIEDLVRLVEREGIVRVKGALSALGYVVYEETPDPVAPPEALSTGRLHVCNSSGEPVVGHQVTIEPVISQQVTPLGDTDYYASLIARSLIFRTGESGELSVPLLKGITVRVYLEGSSLYREIVVPNDDFNLLDPSISTEPDAFSSPVAAPKLVIRGDL